MLIGLFTIDLANDADKWLQKKPLDACKGLIRKWGFLVEYRLDGQKSWSKAIVRQGVADKGAAIESASGLTSGSVVIRYADVDT